MSEWRDDLESGPSPEGWWDTAKRIADEQAIGCLREPGAEPPRLIVRPRRNALAGMSVPDAHDLKAGEKAAGQVFENVVSRTFHEADRGRAAPV